MTTQIFLWWLVVQGFGLAGLPLTFVLFRALPDRGYAFGKTLGLLLTGYLAWLVAMLGLAPFGPALIVVCTLAVAGVGLLAARRRSAGPAAGPAVPLGISATPAQRSFPRLAAGDWLVPWLRENWRAALAYEALFAAALIFLALLRSYEPNPWGTERPMDYALFNAIRRSATFPPHDPWLSGYSINYYYFGYLLMAAVALVSGLDPAVAYNLSLALIFALVALGVAGIVSNLIALADDRRPTTASETGRGADRERGRQGEGQTGRGADREAHGAAATQSSVLGPQSWGSTTPRPLTLWSLVLRGLAPLLSAILVLFAANQGGALQVITGTDMAVALDGPNLARAIENGLGPRAPLALDPPFKGDYFDGTSAITPTDTVTNFNSWFSSRAVWDDYTARGDPVRHYTITEFPFFSFWLGDMHPHVMALPFGLLALALALQTLARPTAPAFALGRRGWLDLALTGVVLGSLYVINSWDFPTYTLLFLGALLVLYARLGTGGRSEIGDRESASPAPDLGSLISSIWWRHYAGQATTALLASVALFAPFYLTFHSLVGGKEPLVGLPILAAITRIVGFFTWSKTPLHSFLIIFGLFLTPLVTYVFAQGWRQGDKETRRQGDKVTGGQNDQEPEQQAPGHPVTRSPGHPVTRSPARYLPWATLTALVLGLLIGFPLLFLLPLALYAAALALERADRLASAFALWAFALGCLICFGTEIVYIRDVFEGYSARMNTIFKFYYQTWLIWGTLAGYALWWLYARVFSARRPGGYLLGALFALLLAGALVYPWLTAGKSFRAGQRVGLAGKTPREQTPDGAAAITWLRANAPDDAVILEAIGDAYDTRNMGFGGVSASTGLAAVLGWPGHEQQWRGGDPRAAAQIGPRQADVETIYNTTDATQARELLAKYKVGYIYVGAAERATYTPEGLAKLAQLGAPVFQEGDVVIYRVN